MIERPILFSAPMVRAILAGTKTQTRRAMKIQPRRVDGGVPFGDAPAWAHAQPGSMVMRCPFGKRGDQLWAREAWRACAEADAVKPRDMDAAYRLWFEADAPHQPGFGKLRPGMFMPRWASRITLKVTGVRVERLQDISIADAMAEGVVETNANLRGLEPCMEWRYAYEDLWTAINGPGSWDANPWVWVVEFAPLTTSEHAASHLSAAAK